MRIRSQSGFTLVEMLVVVAIIALLATFAIPRTYNAWNSSRQAQVAHDMKTVHDALEQHYLDKNYYPLKLNDLIKTGYLKAGFRFKSPVSGKWYLYAVNDTTQSDSARAYILGVPTRDSRNDAQLHHTGPLPEGVRSDWTTYAWKQEHTGRRLWLYTNKETRWPDVPEDGLPDSLESYQISCAPSPCQAYTN